MGVDISTSLTLLNLFTLNIPLTPTPGEMERRFEAEARLKEDLFKDYDGSMPGSKKKPLKIIPIMHVDHIREVDQEQGFLTISATFTFIWMDERLRWNATEYGGLKALAGDKSEFVMQDVWYPCLHLADLPMASKQQDLFLNYDVDLFISNAGTVRASIKVIVTTPCYFGFGDFPNDYQNCSFTLMSPYYADEMQFSNWGGAELASYLIWENDITDVQDFELIDVESQSYFMYLGMKIIDDFTKYRPSLCRTYFRYNMMLKRVNKIVFAQISVPLIACTIFIAMSGIVPNSYGLSALIFSMGFQIMNAINMSQILPDDFNGMPVAGILAMFLMFETITLILWRTFAINIRNSKKFKNYPDEITDESDLKKAVIFDLVVSVDSALTVILLVQAVINIYIIWYN